MDRTLVLVKPDAVQRGLAGEVISRLERRGLKIVALKLMQVDEALARRHYAEHEGKPFLESLLSFITASPIVAAVFEGPNAVETVRGWRDNDALYISKFPDEKIAEIVNTLDYPPKGTPPQR